MGVQAEQKGGRVVKSGANRYRYDACGRLAEKIVDRHGFRPQRWQYRWNSDNRLTDLYTPNNEHWRYEYDAFGRRTRKFNFSRSNKRGTHYAHSEQHIIGEEYLWSGEQLLEAAPIYADGTVAFEHATRWSYAPGGINPLAQQQGEKLWYIVTDHLGTPRELLDESGQLGWSNSPSVWGQARLWQAANDEFASSNVVPINKTTCPIRFPGQYYDEESGLHYNRHRYYDPETAQYLSPDPIGLAGRVRPQGYVHNPNSWVDPLGLAGDCIDKPDHGAGKSSKRYGHARSEHGSQRKAQELMDRAKNPKDPKPQGHFIDNRMIEEAFEKAPTTPGVHDVHVSKQSNVYYPDGTTKTTNIVRVIISERKGPTTAYPYVLGD
ncbi:RHS repeat domain-containing protein [Pseudomonas protegens]|uniref:RHS repeat domain-containing protein n=1 Tax=Pseudomonas protegens TaxID=380021 RepID=UPI0024E2605F|nr:RHS repeat-associated core domain-containing protein [Pseudomonas protegens]